ncbi:hypothetical protein WAK64_18915 [Bacillus spongiae]|uniref:Uncharacterized protein n=1 Tax=Bacillus spongiae TaxID=2683610 RepID=A0ABU8HI99_9BACI
MISKENRMEKLEELMGEFIVKLGLVRSELIQLQLKVSNLENQPSPPFPSFPIIPMVKK